MMRLTYCIRNMLVAFFLGCVFAGCELEDPTEGVKTEDVIYLTVGDDDDYTLYADGSDSLTLTATLGSGSDANKRITFTTTAGTFAEATDDPQKFSWNASGRFLTATLISGLDVKENVIVTASVGGFVAIKSIAFVRALPNKIELISDPPSISAGPDPKATITATLLRDRDSSKVSNRTRVDFVVTPEGNSDAKGEIVTPVVFSNFTSDNQKATTDLRRTTNDDGFVIVTASADGANGKRASGSIRIEFLKPTPTPTQ